VALSPAQRDALISAEGRLTADVRRRLTEYATRLWGSMGSWRDADVDRFIEIIIPKVLAGQKQVAQLTDTYLAKLAETKPSGTIHVDDLRGVPDEQVYRRPATTLYTSLSNGSDFDQAQKEATARLVSLLATGMQMAKVRQARQTLYTARGIEAFRRVLKGPKNCTLCIIASTQRYWKRDLLPIHPGCDCEIDTLGIGDHSEQVLDRDLLEQVHAQVEGFVGASDRGGRAPDYRKLIATNEHGEIGPLLGWKHQNFTGPGDI
jgi:hypothetical protein